MSLSFVPAEVLHSVCAHLPNRDLVQVACTNSTLSAISQRILYRHISLVVTGANASLVSTLAARPDLALLARSFSLAVHEDQSAMFYHYLSAALKGMTELQSLDLLIDPDASWVLIDSVSKAIEYPRLRHFNCSFALDQNVANFLAHTPEIVELEVHGAAKSSFTVLPCLSSSSIPYLSRFQGPCHVAELLVPGRPVEALYLSSGVLDKPILSQLARSTSPVLLLDATTSATLVSCLEAVADNLPSLTYLRLLTLLPFGDHPDPTFHDQVSKVLGRLPDLTTFQLSGMNWTSWLAHGDSLSDRKRIWQSRPLSPLLPLLDMRGGDMFNFSEDTLVF